MLLVTAGIVAAFHVGKVPPALPSLRAETGATLSQGGWLLAIVNLVTALAGMAIALTADRFGHRRLIMMGTAITTATSLLGAFAGTIEVLLVLRLFEGLGFIAVAVAIPSLVVRLAAPADTRRAMTLWAIYMPIGAGAMMTLSAVTLIYASWRTVWLVAAAASGLMMLALLLRTLRRTELDPPPVAARPVFREIIEVATSGGPLAIALCFGAYACCWFAVVGFLPTLQTERLGFSASTAAIVTAAITFVNFSGNLLAGTLLGRGVSRGTIIVGATVSMAFCASALFLDVLPDIVRLVLAGVYSALIGAVPAALFTALPVHAPRPQLVGASNGLLMQGSNLGALLGPPITAAVVASAGWAHAAWVTSISLGIAAAAGVFLHLRERRKLAA
ncbi:MAG TPA: MFS transporter [Reyranellaceae bacterium]|nr:MFS transporter [Reyranellaceae bacterium]